MEPPETHKDGSRVEVETDGGSRGRLLRCVAEARSALDQLEAELSHPSSKGPARNARKSAPPGGGAGDRELKRLQRELAQRRLELTELRTEGARALHRAEQENERLRVELADLQQRFDATLNAQRSSGVRGGPAAGPTEPPAVSGVEGRQKAETLRPRARARGR